MRVANWNIEWAGRSPSRASRVRKVIRRLDAEVLCVTEGSPELLPDGGHIVSSEANCSYKDLAEDERQVLLWSRNGWNDVDQVGNEILPTGCFVAGSTETSIGQVRMIGVCISYHMAGVAKGLNTPWELNMAYLRGLADILKISEQPGPTLVVGDFNHRIPYRWGKRAAFDLLTKALEGWRIATEGAAEGLTEPVIDHIAHTPDLRLLECHGWHRRSDGKRLSDHDGVWARFES